jgi:hypothetical protein
MRELRWSLAGVRAAWERPSRRLAGCVLVAAALAAAVGGEARAADRAAKQYPGTYSGTLTYSTSVSIGPSTAVVTMTGSWTLTVAADDNANGSFDVKGALAYVDNIGCSISAPETLTGTFTGTVAGGTATLTMPYTSAATTETLNCPGYSSSLPVPSTSGSLSISLPLDSLVKTGSYTTQGLTFGLSQSPSPPKPACPKAWTCTNGKLTKLKLRQGTAFIKKGSRYRKIGRSAFPELSRGSVYFAGNRLRCQKPAGANPCRVYVYTPKGLYIVSGRDFEVGVNGKTMAVSCFSPGCDISKNRPANSVSTLSLDQKVVVKPGKTPPQPKAFNPSRVARWWKP